MTIAIAFLLLSAQTPQRYASDFLFTVRSYTGKMVYQPKGGSPTPYAAAGKAKKIVLPVYEGDKVESQGGKILVWVPSETGKEKTPREIRELPSVFLGVTLSPRKLVLSVQQAEIVKSDTRLRGISQGGGSGGVAPWLLPIRDGVVRPESIPVILGQSTRNDILKIEILLPDGSELAVWNQREIERLLGTPHAFELSLPSDEATRKKLSRAKDRNGDVLATIVIETTLTKLERSIRIRQEFDPAESRSLRGSFINALKEREPKDQTGIAAEDSWDLLEGRKLFSELTYVLLSSYRGGEPDLKDEEGMGRHFNQSLQWLDVESASLSNLLKLFKP